MTATTRFWTTVIQNSNPENGAWHDQGQPEFHETPANVTAENVAHRVAEDNNLCLTLTRVAVWDATDTIDHGDADVDADYLLDYPGTPRGIGDWSIVSDAGIEPTIVEAHYDNQCGTDIGQRTATPETAWGIPGDDRILFGPVGNDGSARPGEHLGWFANTEEWRDGQWRANGDQVDYWAPQDLNLMLDHVKTWVDAHTPD